MGFSLLAEDSVFGEAFFAGVADVFFLAISMREEGRFQKGVTIGYPNSESSDF